MQRFLFILAIFLVGIVYLKYDFIVEKVNDFKEPALNIAAENISKGDDGSLTFKVILNNATDKPIFVGKLVITYIIFIDDDRYTVENKDIEIGKTIDEKNPLDANVILSDYFNPDFEPTASLWIRNKRKNFGIKISVQDNFDESIQWTKIKPDS